MGGRGASSMSRSMGAASPQGMTDGQIADEMAAIRRDMDARAKAMDDIEMEMKPSARNPTGDDLKHREWLDMLGVQKERQARLQELSLEQVRRYNAKQPKPEKKPFINGFGEATDRYISASTYERARKRIEREAEGFLTGVRPSMSRRDGRRW